MSAHHNRLPRRRPGPRPVRGLSTLGIVLVLAGVAAALALTWWYARAGRAAAARIDEARVVAVERRDLLDAVTATGRVEPVARVAVMSRASGILKVLAVDEGDVVHEGQVLAELDREQIEAQVAQDTADLQAADARLAAARASLEEARLRVEDPELAFLERETDRLKGLSGKGTVSVQEREDAERQLAIKRFAVELLRARLPALAASVSEAEAQLAAAQAALDRSGTTLRETTIRCPIDGVVLVRDKEVGDGVSSILTAGGNATRIFSLGDLSRMHVEARVDEVDLGRIRVGMPAVVTVDAHRGRELAGRVERVAPAGSVDSNGIVTFEVRVAVDDPDGLLKPDMTADAKLVVDRRDGVTVLPQRAFRRSADGSWSVSRVVGAGREARLESVPVELGLSDGLMTEVRSGLAEGERVLVPETLARPAARP
jgi:HlyD family secretion protein